MGVGGLCHGRAWHGQHRMFVQIVGQTYIGWVLVGAVVGGLDGTSFFHTPCLRLALCLCLCLCLSLSVSVCLSVSLSLARSLARSLSLSLIHSHTHVCLSFCLSVCLSVCHTFPPQSLACSRVALCPRTLWLRVALCLIGTLSLVAPCFAHPSWLHLIDAAINV